MRCPKYWSFSFSISPSNEYPGLISLRMDHLDLLAVQGTLKMFKSINFLVLSFLPSPTLTSIHNHWKNHSLDQTDLCWSFLPRSKCLLISWLQSPSVVILEPKKLKSDTVSTVSPSISHEVMGPDAMILVFWMLSFKPGIHLYKSISQKDTCGGLHQGHGCKALYQGHRCGALHQGHLWNWVPLPRSMNSLPWVPLN